MQIMREKGYTCEDVGIPKDGLEQDMVDRIVEEVIPDITQVMRLLNLSPHVLEPKSIEEFLDEVCPETPEEVRIMEKFYPLAYGGMESDCKTSEELAMDKSFHALRIILAQRENEFIDSYKKAVFPLIPQKAIINLMGLIPLDMGKKLLKDNSKYRKTHPLYY